jgi:hypothetical protein
VKEHHEPEHMLNGFLCVLRCRGLKGGYSDTNLELLAREAKQFGVNHIRIESNFGDSMFTKLISPVAAHIHRASSKKNEARSKKSAASSTPWSR